jgi:hypothetical protein
MGLLELAPRMTRGACHPGRPPFHRSPLRGYVDSEPGSLRGIQVNVDDVSDVHAFLLDRGVQVSEIQECPWGRFCFLSARNGNGWSVHEPPRPS